MEYSPIAITAPRQTKKFFVLEVLVASSAPFPFLEAKEHPGTAFASANGRETKPHSSKPWRLFQRNDKLRTKDDTRQHNCHEPSGVGGKYRCRTRSTKATRFGQARRCAWRLDLGSGIFNNGAR
jgi:hypothetical protein